MKSAERKVRKDAALAALTKIITALESRDLLEKGNVQISNHSQHAELMIPIKLSDWFIWDEVLNAD